MACSVSGVLDALCMAGVVPWQVRQYILQGHGLVPGSPGVGRRSMLAAVSHALVR